jgi:hypothetical protein
MWNILIVFKIMNDDEAVPLTFQEITCHIIFDVKVEYFRRKERFVAGGHTTDTPHGMTDVNVVS